jgi:hypothetical protein
METEPRQSMDPFLKRILINLVITALSSLIIMLVGYALYQQFSICPRPISNVYLTFLILGSITLISASLLGERFTLKKNYPVWQRIMLQIFLFILALIGLGTFFITLSYILFILPLNISGLICE